MLSYLRLAIRFLRTVARSDLDVAVENLALQQQLMVLTRSPRRPRLTLADRFFSSVYGPTGIEHLWTVAAQSDRFVDQELPNQWGTGEPRELCDDARERAFSFRKLLAECDTIVGKWRSL